MKENKLTADAKLSILINNCVQLGHRALLVIKGQELREQVMILHHLIGKHTKERPSILWCHHKDSDAPRQSRKKLKKLEKKLKSGNCDISKENAFELFLLSTSIKYCSFSDSQRILGTSYGMCIIQDFYGLTPNVLCRLVETVKGGGAVVFLLPEITNLRELFDLQMDAHYRLKTHSYSSVTPLFNERFVLSLGWCKSCLILDENLEVQNEIPAISGVVLPVKSKQLSIFEAGDMELTKLLESLADADKPLPQIIGLCKTADQAKAVLKMIDIVTEKSGRATVSLTAGRGRGKSAAMGLGVAAAVYFGVNNMFVVSPSPQNLGTFFEFLFKGFDAFDYQDLVDYEIIQSTNPVFNNAIVRVNVFKKHRQIVQYVEPSDVSQVSQAELVVIDEAAAIPLPQVKALFGQHNVFLASTINGYEGTGRSLSLKLLQQLRQQNLPTGSNTNVTTAAAATSTQALHEITLETSVRYRDGDTVESWLNKLLCLDATSMLPSASTCPPPSACQLYYINRDVLFSGQDESESFLQQIMSLLVASHYRNSPDDLQILSEAPAHHLFVLLPPIPPNVSALPTVLSVIQVCMEGGISSKVSKESLRRGDRQPGDLVPWTLATQFLKPSLTKHLGLRVVRIATHPDYQSMGYGFRAISLLNDYYTKKFVSMEDDNVREVPTPKEPKEDAPLNTIVPRECDHPLMSNLSERVPEELDYLSVSYGITLPLLKFWTKCKFIPLYISQGLNKVTAEHNCIMVCPIKSDEVTDDYSTNEDSKKTTSSSPKWICRTSQEFLRRFVILLGAQLGDLDPSIALQVFNAHFDLIESSEIKWRDLKTIVSGHDLQRLDKYAKNLADRHLITDLLPSVADLYFSRRLPSINLSQLQSSLLIGMGLQLHKIEEVASQVNLPVESALGQFNRSIRRLLGVMSNVQETAVSKHLPAAPKEFIPVSITLDQELEDAAKDYEKNAAALKATQLGDIRRFAILGDDSAWDQALESGQASNIVSVKSNKRPAKMTETELEQELEPTKKKKGNHQDKNKDRNNTKPVGNKLNLNTSKTKFKSKKNN